MVIYNYKYGTMVLLRHLTQISILLSTTFEHPSSTSVFPSMAGRGSSESNKPQSSQTETKPEGKSSNPNTMLTTELKVPPADKFIITQGQRSRGAGLEGLNVVAPVEKPETMQDNASQAVAPRSNDITQGHGSRAAPAPHDGSSNVSGAEDVLIVKDSSSEIHTSQDFKANLGYRSGVTITDGNQKPPPGCSGTRGSFQASNGGKLNLSGTFNLGAFSGGGGAKGAGDSSADTLKNQQT